MALFVDLCLIRVTCCCSPQFGEDAEGFDELDVNHDGVVDASEWAKGVDVKMQKNRGMKSRGR